MTIFSRPIPLIILKNINYIRLLSRKSNFYVTPTRWQWLKFKDFFHYYASLGILFSGIIILCSNIFIGPAKLEPFPDDYQPKHWEYYRHPITRFIVRSFGINPQQEYEKLMHFMYEEDERKRIRNLEIRIRQRMIQENDYQAWYYTPILAKYVRESRAVADYLASLRGD